MTTTAMDTYASVAVAIRVCLVLSSAEAAGRYAVRILQIWAEDRRRALGSLAIAGYVFGGALNFTMAIQASLESKPVFNTSPALIIMLASAIGFIAVSLRAKTTVRNCAEIGVRVLLYGVIAAVVLAALR